MKELYENNERFKAFVDKCSKTYGISVEELLTHRTVREVAEYYRKDVLAIIEK